MLDNWWDIDAEDMEPNEATHKCSDCYYWIGNPGNMLTDFICAVNIPQPSRAELERVDNRKSYALHNCPDFEQNHD